jgi:hypothetical protein
LLEKKLLHFLKVVELAVAKTWWAISLVAVNAEVAILVAGNYSLASEALAGGVLCILSNHALLILATLSSVSLNTLEFGAESKTLLLSSMKNKLVGEILDDIIALLLKLLDVEVLDALMVTELSSSIFFVTDLAHDENLGTVIFDMLMKLGSS